MSIGILKIIGILVIISIIAAPFLSLNYSFSFFKTSYKSKYRRNNLVFVVLTSIEIFIICFLFPPLINIVNAIRDWGFIEWIASKVPDRIEYAVSTITLLLFNILLCVALLIVKRLVRIILDKKVFVEAALYESSFKKSAKKTTKKKNSKKESSEKKLRALRKNSVLVLHQKRKRTVLFRIVLMSMISVRKTQTTKMMR